MKSWKTTSAGITAIATGLATLYFERQSLNGATFGACIASIMGGIGLIFSQDEKASK